MEILSIFKLIIETAGDYWPVVALIIAVVAAYIYGSQRMAVLVGVIGLAIVGYLKGRKDANARAEKIAREISEKREKAYEKIDARNTSRDDVAERLRKRNY